MEGLLTILRAQLHNQFFSGGLVLMVTGAAMALCRQLPGRVFAWLKRRTTVTVEIMSDDPLFDNITLWLDTQPYSKRSRRLTARSFAELGNDGEIPSPVAYDEERRRPRIIFSPAPGDHIFFYKGKPLWLSRNRDNNTPQGGQSNHGMGGAMSFRKYETFTITALGTKQRVIRDLVEEAVTAAMESQKDKISTYVSSYGSWDRLGSYSPRQLESVILPGNTAEEIEKDLRKFLASRNWYTQIGIPWHRGYMFWGIPGSGKTSFVAALAGRLSMNLYLLNVAGSGVDDERLVDLVRRVRAHSILLLEDVDAADSATENRTAKSEENRREVTLSGLLNCLDGLLSKEGCVVFMTTNHRNRMDPALLRPGRVDVSVEFTGSTSDQLQRLYERFNPGGDSTSRDRFAAENVGASMAEAQQKLLEQKGFAVIQELTFVEGE